MDEALRKFATAVLVADAKHNRKMQSLEGTCIDPDTFYVELIRDVLDALGVPPDNTVRQAKLHGGLAWEHPDTFCRDWLTDEWFSRSSLTSDTTRPLEQVAAEFVEWVLSETEEFRR